MIKRAVAVAATAALFSLGAGVALAHAGTDSTADAWIGHEEHRALASNPVLRMAAWEKHLAEHWTGDAEAASVLPTSNTADGGDPEPDRGWQGDANS